MKLNESARIIGLATKMPLEEANLPKSLLRTGNGKGMAMMRQMQADWTLQQYYDNCELALANGGSFDQVNNYCLDNIGISFGCLYNFIQLLNNPLML